MKIEFTVPDMTCGHCVQTITRAVHALDQTAEVDITLDDHHVKIETAQSADAVRAVIADAGYTVQGV